MIFYVCLACFSAIFIYFFYLFLHQKFSRRFKHLKKFPKPSHIPLLGDIKLLKMDRNEIFNNVRRRGLTYYPIYGHFILNFIAVAIMDPRDVELVLSSMKNIKKSAIYQVVTPWLGTGLLTSYGHKWQTRRKIITPAFHFSILKEFVNVFNGEAEKLTERLQNYAYQSVNIIPFITDLTLRAITETSMGIKFDIGEDLNKRYKNSIHKYIEIASYRVTKPWLYNNKLFFNITRLGYQCKRLVENLHNYTTMIIEKRKKSLIEDSYAARKRKAFLDILLTAKEQGANIDDKGIREEVDTFMFEGHDTTAVALCFILMTLANYKHAQDEIYQEIVEILGDLNKIPTYSDLQEMHFTERCIKECLRLYPSVPYIGRVAMEDIETHQGYTIPKGALIHIHIYDIHRNPNLYPNPDLFDPDRFLPDNIKARHPFAYIPFSAGPRNCIGQKFAILELKAVVCAILKKFKLEPIDSHVDMEFIVDFVLRTKNPIRVRFVPRNKE